MQSFVSILLLAAALPGLAMLGGFEGGSHDFAFVPEDGRVGCAACHHPHTPAGEAARWQAEARRTRRFPLYTTRTGLPGKSTLICLSCHDGAIAPEVHVAGGQTIVSQIGRSRAPTGSRLSLSFGSHPVGVRYGVRAEEFVPKAAVEADGAVRLPEGRVECISCHDPHGTAGFKRLLVKSNRRSALCLSCHRL